MTTLGHSSGKPLNLLPKWLMWGLIIVSFIGFLDASYLTAAHYAGFDLTCTILKGCEEVTTSEYSVIFGVPVALLGVFYYLTVFLLSLIYFDTKNRFILKIIPPLTVAGLLASAGFVYLQLFVIKAICEYCMLSAATSTTLFIFGIFVFKTTRNKLKIN